MNRRLMMSLLVVLTVLIIAFLLVVPPVASGSSGDDSSSFVPFIPIWFVAMIPIFESKRQERKKQEKAKRRLKTDDRYTMMKNLVHQLNNDELQYLHHRLYEMSGDTMARQ
jgi:hypothetical protein